MPQILKVKPDNPESWGNMIAETQKVLKGGGIVAFPTDTFYGLGANPYNKRPLTKFIQLKAVTQTNHYFCLLIRLQN